MAKQKIDLKKLLIPSDFIAIFVILLGLLIAIFLTEIAIRLIGISVAILGAVALFMLVSQRISEYVEVKHTSKVQPQNFKTTKKKETGATRTVFEDFSTSFGPEPDTAGKPQAKKSTPEYMSDDEGFRVVNKSNRETSTKIDKENDKSLAPPIHEKVNTQDIAEFAEENSGMRVVGKFKGDSSKVRLNITDRIAKPDDTVEDSTKPNEAPASETQQIKYAFESRRNPPAVTKHTEPVIEQIPSNNETKNESSQTPAKATAEPKIDHEKVVTPEPSPEKEKQSGALGYKEKLIDVQVNVLIEDLQSLGHEPRKEFDYFLNRVLIIIRSVTNTRTASFLLVNSEKKQMILEAFSTDVPHAIITKNKMPLGNDIVSQIFLNHKPEIVTEINPSAELDLIPYYAKSVKTGSFIGVPVYFNDSVVGVLCADTNVNDAYDAMTVTFFGHFTKLISALVQSYTEKYDLLQESRTLQAINKFKSARSDLDKSVKDIEDSMVQAAATIMDGTTIGFCGYDMSDGAWVVKSLKAKDERSTSLLRTPIEMNNSLVGKAISTGKPIIQNRFDTKLIRINKNEPTITSGYFAAIPIHLYAFDGVYGSLFIEGANSGSISSTDIDILSTICEHAGMNIERLHLLDILHSGAMYDTGTGMLNPQAFMQRLSEEYLRNAEQQHCSSLVLIQPDYYASFDPTKFKQRSEKVIMHLIEKIKSALRKYDLFGRIDDNTFSVLLIGMKAQQAQIWAEKLRRDIASSVIDIDGRRFNTTISMGISESQNTASMDGFVINARSALTKSSEKTNSVAVFA